MFKNSGLPTNLWVRFPAIGKFHRSDADLDGHRPMMAIGRCMRGQPVGPSLAALARGLTPSLMMSAFRAVRAAPRARWRAHPVLAPAGMAAPTSHLRRRSRERDATEDYPESHPEAAGLRVRCHPARGERRTTAARGRAPAPGQPAAAMLAVSAAPPRLRHLGPAPVRVRARVGHRGLLPVRGAARPVCPVWR